MFDWLARHVAEEELRRVFNLGIGLRGRRRRPATTLVIGRRRRVIGVLVSGDGTNLQALHRRGLPVGAVASNRPAPRARAGRARRIPTAVFALATTPSREERDARWPTGSRARRRLVVLAGYMHLLHDAVLRPVPRPRDQRASVAAPRSSPVRTQSRTRSCGRARDRCHRPLRRRRRRHRARIRPGTRPVQRGRHGRDAGERIKAGRAPSSCRRR